MQDKLTNFRSKKGFTLIEVLIASVILFAVISTASLVYRTAVKASLRAEHSLYINGLLPTIISQVENDILAKSETNSFELIGEGAVLEASYHWTAELIAFESAPERFDTDKGEFVTPPKKFKLWQVNITINRDQITTEYQFKSLGWNLE